MQRTNDAHGSETRDTSTGFDQVPGANSKIQNRSGVTLVEALVVILIIGIPGQEINVVNYSGFYGFHAGGIEVVAMDGSTHTLSSSTEGKVVRSMVTIASGEVESNLDQ